jgi:hypothetical protein
MHAKAQTRQIAPLGTIDSGFPISGFDRQIPRRSDYNNVSESARKTLRSGSSCFFRPSDSQKKGAIFQSLHIVRKRSLQCQHVPGRQVNHLVLHMHSDVACDSLDRNPTGGLMFVKTRIGLQGSEYYSKIGMFH